MKVLFIRFSSLGDVVLTTGVLNKFHDNFPDAEISILTGKGLEPIFEGLDFIKKVFLFDRKSGFLNYIKFIETNLSGFDYIIDLHSNLRSKMLRFSVEATYLHYKKHSFKRRMFVKHRWFKKELQDHVVSKYYKTISNYFNTSLPELEELRPVLASKYYNNVLKNHIVIHAQASKVTKEWPHFNELTNRLLDNGMAVTIVGTKAENIDSRVNNLTGKTTLSELIHIISTANIVITTDSGPMHIAVALNKKTIVLAGCTTDELGFLPKFANCTVVDVKNLKCRPCHVHGLESCPEKHFKCMNDISIENIIEKL